MITEEETKEVIARFLCEIGAWLAFKTFIEKQGYTLEELGFDDD